MGVSSETEVWRRREAAFTAAAPYVGLAACTIASAIADRNPVTLGLAGVTALWLRFGSRRIVPFYVVLVLLGLALVALQPWYGFFAFTTYFFVERLPAQWRWAGVTANAIVVATSQVGGIPSGAAWHFLVWVVVVAINVVVANSLIAFAFASDRRIDDLTEANRRLEVTLRENAGLHAQLVTQAHEAGVLDERARMAREIHDTLAQGLAGIIRQLEAAAENPVRWQSYHESAERLARESLTEARRSVHALRPEPLTSAGLPRRCRAWRAGGLSSTASRPRWSPPATRARCRRTSRSRCCGRPRRR